MVAADSEGTTQIDASEAGIDAMALAGYRFRCHLRSENAYEEDRNMPVYTVQQLQTAVTRRSAQELARFRQWLEEFEAPKWDEKFESDVKSGKLDHLAEQAIADLRAGNCLEL